MNYNTKQKLKKAGLIALAFGALIVVMALIGNMTKGFTTFDPDEMDLSNVNENNLITVDAYTKDSYKTNTDVVIKQKDGVLTLSGKPSKDGTGVSEVLGTVTLPAGTYTFTTGKDGENDKTNPEKYYMYLDGGTTVILGDSDVAFDSFKGNPFTLESETTFAITLRVMPGVDVDGVKLYPAVFEGDEAEGFFEPLIKTDKD